MTEKKRKKKKMKLKMMMIMRKKIHQKMGGFVVMGTKMNL